MTAPTITLFLLARIAEDEAVARAAGDEAAPEWMCEEQYGSLDVRTRDVFGNPGYMEHLYITHDREGLSDSVSPLAGTHIARHDPARELAECEAKRRIVGRCRPQYAIWYRESDRLIAEGFSLPTVPTVAHSDAIWPFDGAEAILRDLAALYADHPDYDESWRPRVGG